MFERLLRVLASLRLTAICLAFALMLVLAGTLAQVNEGLYQAQTRYFRSFVVWWSPANSGFQVPVLPGGYAVGSVLLVNLIVAHIQRFGVSRKRLGILMIHSGLVLLLLGQLFTDILSRESTLRLKRGATSAYSESFSQCELVLVDTNSPNFDKVVSVSQPRLARRGAIHDEQMPVTVRVKEFWPNARLFASATNGAAPVSVSQGIGTNGLFLQKLPLATGTDERNTPAAIAELLTPSASLGTWLLSPVLRPQGFTLQGRTWEIMLRPKRHYTPYSLTLLDLRHDIYKGTDIPRNFSSRVRIQNPQTREDREVLIYMNHPLRYRGETYYQHQMNKATDLSVLQVVRNPGWMTPYISCVMVGAG